MDRFTPDAPDRVAPSRADLRRVLGGRRRRYALHYLKRRPDGTTSLCALATRVASWERARPIDRLPDRERERVRTSLLEVDLPELEAAGLVAYDPQSGAVELTEAASARDFYVDRPSARAIPWRRAYLAFAGLGAGCLLGVRFAPVPFDAPSPLAASLALVVLLGALSVAHLYDARARQRVGARETPAELGASDPVT